MLIDRNVHAKKNNNFVFQDFGKSFYHILKEATTAFQKYKKLVLVYPTFTHHPTETVDYFKTYCQEEGFSFEFITNSKDFNIKKDEAYISYQRKR